MEFESKRRIRSSKLLRPCAPGRWPLLVVFGILAANRLLAQGTSLTGSVVDDIGNPVAGTRVLISYAPSVQSPLSAPPVVTGPLAATVVSDAQGSFSIDSLPPAQYIACAETVTPGLLDPCHWSTTAPNFAVAAGQAVSGVNLVMAKGAVLQIHVNDPQQLLSPVNGPLDFNLQIHIITGKGLHYNALIQSSTATGRDHAITIPFGTPVTLRVLSSHFVVYDQSGNPFPSTGTTINVPAGTTPQAVQLAISGKN